MTDTDPAALGAAAGGALPLKDRLSRAARVVTRLDRMLTEADDYSWVPMGDVLVAILDTDAAEEAWPEGVPATKLDTLLRAALSRHHEPTPVPVAPSTRDLMRDARNGVRELNRRSGKGHGSCVPLVATIQLLDELERFGA